MAKYVKNANGYHKVIDKGSISGKATNITACGINVVENLPTVDSAMPPKPYCKMCQNPAKAEVVQKALKLK